MGAGQSKAKDGKDGISVKDWGLWSESDKTEFITAIRNNEVFRNDVKNKLSSDVEFRSVIANLMKEDSSFKSSFINSLAADVPFRNSVATAVNNASFKTDITGQLVATILKDPGFIAAARGPKGDIGPKGDSIVGPKGDSIVGPVGPIGLTPQITEASITGPVSAILAKDGLWCANGQQCRLPKGKPLRIEGQNMSLHPDSVLSADLDNNPGGRLNLTKDTLTVGVNARFRKGIQVGDLDIFHEVTKLRDDVTNLGESLNDIRHHAMRTDRNYRVQSRRINQTNWFLRHEDGNKIMWANGGDGDKEAIRFIGANFQA